MVTVRRVARPPGRVRARGAAQPDTLSFRSMDNLTHAPHEREVDRHRRSINAIDQELLRLLNRRSEHAQQIGLSKRRAGLAILQPLREQRILDELKQLNPGPLRPAQIERIWGEIFSASRSLQQAAPIAFLGPSGTYSEDAVIRFFGDTALRIGCATLGDAFDAVASGAAPSAVVPFENSAHGCIADTLDLLARTGVPASGEVVLPIVHCLLSHARDLSAVDCVLGHAQALAQSRNWLDRHLPGVERRAVSSNAAAAKAASENATYAALAGERAGQLYGVAVLQRAVQDQPSNRTRFLIIGDAPRVAASNGKTLIRAEIEHHAGSLARLLAPLQAHGVSIDFLETRPLGNDAWTYCFYLELAGFPHEAPVAAALAEMTRQASAVAVLGSYGRSTACAAPAAPLPTDPARERAQ
ncbi:chorismate mutase [Burkholderia sp. AU42008]|uniref:bifunctional chorismate mutase/prephenate dehydratase n=2 Tax=Burkholderia TaxID=32008 RepID=UPI000B7AC599|nr:MULTISPECIES: bifunctional chorismate mutase/prephenate dehydratase [unclassified Burkholderia]MBR8234925.1 chorismate mutase [Burkholderia sp. AU32357]MBY4875862.1 chorismate mutase [Burkholderia sp. AU42008]OXI39211.1 chorismate mutase [Burkholderia sp. AU17457]